MFTGLVEVTSTVQKFQKKSPSGAVLTVSKPKNFKCKLGDSIAINGCCLTLSSQTSKSLAFELSGETLSLTSFSSMKIGQKINMERALRLGDRLGGHWVSGHVDGLGEVVENGNRHGDWTLVVKLDSLLGRQCIHKGSICVDGVSLTINEMRDTKKNTEIRLTLIPETLKRTNLHGLKEKDLVHIETDILAKFAERQRAKFN